MSSRNSARSIAAGALRAEMARRRKTSVDLARVLGVSQSSASRRMNGDAALDVDEIATIANWLEVPPAQLLGAQPTTEVVAS